MTIFNACTKPQELFMPWATANPVTSEASPTCALRARIHLLDYRGIIFTLIKCFVYKAMDPERNICLPKLGGNPDVLLGTLST